MLFPCGVTGVNKKITFAKPCGVNGTIVFRTLKMEGFLYSLRCKRRSDVAKFVVSMRCKWKLIFVKRCKWDNCIPCSVNRAISVARAVKTKSR